MSHYIRRSPCTADLGTTDEEAVNDVDSDTAVQHRQEESEEPPKRDHLQNLQLKLEQLVQVWKMLLRQMFKYN